MNVSQLIDFLQKNERFAANISSLHEIPAREERSIEIPEDLPAALKGMLQAQGIKRLYIHQAETYRRMREGRDVVVVTPTASGKSLSYLLPVLHRKLENPEARTILLFPTKALSRDQQAAIENFSEAAKMELRTFTYDGDTSASARNRIRESGDFVITNPDMLHAGILPHHTMWIRLFENLETIVVDEMHTYRGVFGSHFANVMRRLLRIAAFYGKSPRIICASATIGNPGELAEKLFERPFDVVDENGAPSGRKVFLFYNPPVVQKELGIRVSSVKEAAKLGGLFVDNNVHSILFCRSRTRVEVLTNYLKEASKQKANRVMAYRGGYLPNERRSIERDLREGKLLAVVSTNALELGIDIGSLDVSITVGFPGSISSLLQQSGRAGRKQNDAISILIATSEATDQYVVQHPEFLLGRSPEHGRINADNLLILIEHLKCAVFELPFKKGESFGRFAEVTELLDLLAQGRIVTRSGDDWHWSDDSYPANNISLRAGPRENFVIVDISDTGREKIIGEIDRFAAPTMIHPHAIYLHQSEPYYVEELLWEDRIAKIRKVEVDYYTDAQEKVDVSILESEVAGSCETFDLYKGELQLQRRAVMFKKIKFETHENLGWGDIHLPELEMHTQGFWMLFRDLDQLPGLDSDARIGATLAGVAHALGVVAPIHAMCDPRDMRFHAEVRNPVFALPCIYAVDNFPGGLELAYYVLGNLEVISQAAHDHVAACACEDGCPACIGLSEEKGMKSTVLALLERICAEREQR
ncbi:DEAD/DEAH box helicase [Leptonema illini]|uniref:DEAD/DEAH box helicase domain protein n=1 Tax=Leptonema illini DSM 21528 TaxID=929563 RepID=H2CI26_9LEPT|nr:DEAD/DEAH box helicase [Leptonema illini]EHQ08049.1 DEAD/DEAH box helicase domain protein [Leptonema illini DSM 21528]